MLYFIPAWYQQNQWCENEQSWWSRHMHTEFDDTVKQIQLFHRSGACPYHIILLSFTPNFRHFLHRQGVYRAPYWSCFDAIQEVARKKAAVLSFHNLKWPEKIEFIYSMFAVVAMLHKKKYAQIDFGEDGNPIRIDLYQDEKLSRRNIYDDRGFLASTILYEDGKPVHQDYLTEKGIWKMRAFYKDGHVQINEKCPEYLLQHQNEMQSRRFSRLSYENMEQVICEVLTSYVELTKKQDVFCAAMHERHAGLLKKVLGNRKLILSFYEDRYQAADHPDSLKIIEEADYVIVDSEKNVRKIQKDSEIRIENIIAIPPYDSRVDSGISQQLDVQKILVPIDGMEEEKFSHLIRSLGEYLLVNKDARIYLFTRRAEYVRKQNVLEQVRGELQKAGLEEGWAAEKEQEKSLENDLELEESVPVRFFVEQCIDELAVSKCMREQRVLVDVREIPELYLQITAISMGIPQIVRTETEFVEHGRNGIVLRSMDQLPDAVNYYLDGLKNWNQAMICSYELVKEYTTEKLLEKWKEVMDSVGADLYSTVRE